MDWHHRSYTRARIHRIWIASIILTGVIAGMLLPLPAQAQSPEAIQRFYVDAVNGSNTSGNGSQASPWKTITYALGHVSGPEVEIYAAAGFYDQALGEVFPIVMEVGVSVIGAGTDRSILYGNSSTYVIHFPGTVSYISTSMIQGFKITHGSEGVRVEASSGGTYPTIQDNWITGNTYGIHTTAAESTAAYPTIRDNLISENSAHGIYNEPSQDSTRVSPTIENNQIQDNLGSGIYCYAAGSGNDYSLCSPTIRGNRISGNHSHGIACHTHYVAACSPLIQDNAIQDNQGWGWYRSYSGNYLDYPANTPVFINDVISNNTSGGVLQITVSTREDQATLVNCTIANNASYGIRSGAPTIVNSIIWGHTDNLDTPSTSVSYSDLGDNEYDGVNHNISSDPHFVDPLHRDYHVTPGSPVANNGNSAYPNLPTEDIDGDPRILGAGIDMGADETAAYGVSIAKTVEPAGTVYPGDWLTYTLSLTNLGQASAGGVLVTDTLPSQTAWADSLQHIAGYAQYSNGVLTWLGTLPVTNPQTITYRVRANPSLPIGSTITNTALVKDWAGTITETLHVTNTVGPGIFMDSSQQSVNAAYAVPGQQLNYTIQIFNTGNIPATGVLVTDTLDSNVVFSSADPGGLFANEQVTWTGLFLPASTGITLQITVTVIAPLADSITLTNQVCLAADELPPYNLATDQATTLVYNPVQVDFTATPTLGAVPLNVTFNNASTHATTCLWGYGDGTTGNSCASHTHDYTAAGTYTVTLQAANPASAAALTRPGYVVAYHSAQANFTASPTNGLLPLVVTFTNNSQYAQQYIWNYGDGITSTITTTTHTHTYTAPGVYTVSLTATGPYNSNIQTRAGYINVYGSPVASFSASPRVGISPMLVNFTNSSLNATGYLWDFGDGSLSTTVNPAHIYLIPGVYTVTLTAVNPFGSDTLIRPVYISVYDPPVPAFDATPTTGLVPLTVTFHNTSQNATSYEWDYGDGNTSTTADIYHQKTYETAGFYTVTLTAANAYGSNTLQLSHYIQVYLPPLASFNASPTSGVEPLQVNFTNTSLHATDYEWDFGDGTTSTAASPGHAYAAAGMYTVTLQASNPAGSDTIAEAGLITVFSRPVPDFSAGPQSGFLSLTVTLTNTSQYADSFLWDYGDGVTSTITAITHTHLYQAPGVYTVTLTAANAHASAILARPRLINVYTVPVAGFEADTTLGMIPLAVSFRNTSQYASEHLWDFGDGSTSTLFEPTHVYQISGVYTVTLTVSNPYTSSLLIRANYITTYATPVVSFEALPRVGFENLSVTFQNTSQFADRFTWEYGDGLTSTLTATQHTHVYTTPGAYTVTLTAANPYASGVTSRSGYIVIHPATQAATYFVDAEGGSNATGNGSQTNPWQTITYALGQVQGPGVEIYIAPGYYNQTLGESFPIVMETGVSLVGGGYQNTTLYGNTSSYVVHFTGAVSYPSTTVIRGFQITHGSEGVRIDGTTSGTSPAIFDNWITGSTYGLRIQTVNFQKASPVIQDNWISGNSSYGIYNNAGRYGTRVTPTIASNQITENTGAGIFCFAEGVGSMDYYSICSPTITGNRISDNHSHGIAFQSAYWGICSSLVQNNVIQNNQGWGWYRTHSGTYPDAPVNMPVFVNNVISGNTSGGVLLITASSRSDKPVFVNNTIANNTAYGIRNGTPTIVNSIVWGNGDNLNVSATYVSYSDIGDNDYDGINHNISSDPHFVDPPNHDYHLRLPSPVINAGDNAAPNLPATDIDGDSRILGETVDMGADEALGQYSLAVNGQPDFVLPGGLLTYTLFLTNTGVVDLHALITDVLPTETTPTGILTWTATIPARGGTWSHIFTVTVDPSFGGTVTNLLQVLTEEGITGSASCDTVVELPVTGLAALNDSPTPLGISTTLTATINQGSNVSYSWDFGDETYGVGAQVTRRYQQAGVFTATVTAENKVSQATAFTLVWVDDTPPQAADDYATTPEDQPLTIAVLSNDSDPYGLPLAVIGVEPPLHGIAEVISVTTILYTPALNYNGLDQFDYTISDGALTDTATVFITVTAINDLPFVYAGPDQNGSEGETLFFTGVYTDPGRLALTSNGAGILWDFGDGAMITGTLNPTHTYGDNRAYTITLTITDTEGGIGQDSLVMTVNNVCPILEPLIDQTGTTGQVVTVTAAFTDPGWLDAHTAIIRWSAGVTEALELAPGEMIATFSHIYFQSGQHLVSLTVKDDDGGQVDQSFTIGVHDPPIVYAGPDQFGVEGELITFTGVFTEPARLTISQILWQFGDGETITGTLAPTHAYGDNGIYTVTLTITDTWGGVNQDSLQVTVYNVNPIGDPLPDQSIEIGHAVTVTGILTDPGWLDTHIVIIDWADGISEVLQLAAGKTAFTFHHVYTQVGELVVTITFMDDDGGQSVMFFKVWVQPVLQRVYLPVIERVVNSTAGHP